MVYAALLPMMRTPQLPVVDWTDAPADLNGLVRLAERRKMVSARVPFQKQSTTDVQERIMVLEYCIIREENFAVYFEIHSYHAPEQRGEYHKNPQASVYSNILRLETVAS